MVRSPTKSARLGVFALLLALLPAASFALLNIDGTRNQVFVFGEITFGYDSNVFAQRTSAGDYTYNASVGAELKRHAGIISVNARVVFDYQRFAKIQGQNAWNPTFYMELNKTIGRTTGAFTVNAYRSSKADSAVNIRTQSWNFPLGLNIKYPINDKFYVSSQTGYLHRQFADGAGLTNYTDYTQGIDLFYVFTSRLDLVFGYRLRYSEIALGSTVDNNFSFGASGGLFGKVNGSLRFGYQNRKIEYTGESFDQISAQSSATWNVSRKLQVTGPLGKDFTTTATGGSVDTLSASLRGAYVFNRRFQVNGGVGYGRNKFLGVTPSRRDDFFSWDVGAAFSYNDHFRINAAYNYLHNWSTLSSSDFERTGYSLSFAGRF